MFFKTAVLGLEIEMKIQNSVFTDGRTILRHRRLTGVQISNNTHGIHARLSGQHQV